MIPSFLIILAGIFSTVIAIYFYSVGIGSIIAVTNGIILLIIGFYLIGVWRHLQSIRNSNIESNKRQSTTNALLKIIAYNSGSIKEVVDNNPTLFTPNQLEILNGLVNTKETSEENVENDKKSTGE